MRTFSFFKVGYKIQVNFTSIYWTPKTDQRMVFESILMVLSGKSYQFHLLSIIYYGFTFSGALESLARQTVLAKRLDLIFYLPSSQQK